MKNRCVLKGLTVTGTVLLLIGMSGTARAIPISATARHGATPVQAATSQGSFADLGAGALTSAEDRIGSANFSSSGLPQMHHLGQPPKTGPTPGSTGVSPSDANVSDNGKTAMLLGGTFGGMMLARRKSFFRIA